MEATFAATLATDLGVVVHVRWSRCLAAAASIAAAHPVQPPPRLPRPRPQQFPLPSPSTACAQLRPQKHVFYRCPDPSSRQGPALTLFPRGPRPWRHPPHGSIPPLASCTATCSPGRRDPRPPCGFVRGGGAPPPPAPAASCPPRSSAWRVTTTTFPNGRLARRRPQGDLWLSRGLAADSAAPLPRRCLVRGDVPHNSAGPEQRPPTPPFLGRPRGHDHRPVNHVHGVETIFAPAVQLRTIH